MDKYLKEGMTVRETRIKTEGKTKQHDMKAFMKYCIAIIMSIRQFTK